MCTLGFSSTADEIFNLLDKDGSGMVSLQELLQLYLH